jgi:F-type H+-transporting ATPase subunit c
METLAFSLAYALPALGAALGAGLIGMGAMNAAGRNPEKIKELQSLMILAIAFVDALAIIGIVVALISRS